MKTLVILTLKPDEDDLGGVRESMFYAPEIRVVFGENDVSISGDGINVHYPKKRIIKFEARVSIS